MSGRKRKNPNDRKVSGGFSYVVSSKQIREWMNVPIEHRLMWLEEANRFLSKAVRGRRLRILEAFRAGEI